MACTEHIKTAYWAWYGLNCQRQEPADNRTQQWEMVPMHDVHICTGDTGRATPDKPTSTHMHDTHTYTLKTHTHRHTHMPTLQTQARWRLGLTDMAEGKMDLDSHRMWVTGKISRAWQEPSMFTAEGRIVGRSTLMHSFLSRGLKAEGHICSVGLRFPTGYPHSLC